MSKWRYAIGLMLIVVPVFLLGSAGVAVYQKNKASKDAYAAMMRSEAAIACAEWQQQSDRFMDCAEAWMVWRKCKATLEHLGEDSSKGVICEHPTYQFQRRLQTLLDQAVPRL